MLGGMRVLVGDRVISRLSGQKPAALLAYLAYFPRSQPREILSDILWPDSELEAGRASLNQALSTLQRQLEPPGTHAGTLIQSTKTHVSLNEHALTTDVRDFEAAMRRSRAGARLDRVQALENSLDLYSGELLPGFYEDWVDGEQRRLAELHSQAVDSLLALLT